MLATLALLSCAAVIAACGSDDDGTDTAADASAQTEASVAEAEPSLEQDIDSIEQVLLAYGAAEGSSSCDYLAANQITDYGGIEACRSQSADLSGVVFRVENVSVEGDSASAVVTVGGDPEKSYYELVREGDAEDPGGGWKISSYPGDGLGDEAEPEPETAPSDEGENDRADVVALLNAFGEASGSEVCDFFAKSLIEERGGLQACRQYFDGRPALRSEIIRLSVTIPGPYEDVLAAARAVIKSGISGANLYLVLNKTESPLDSYGGWRITRQSD